MGRPDDPIFFLSFIFVWGTEETVSLGKDGFQDGNSWIKVSTLRTKENLKETYSWVWENIQDIKFILAQVLFSF